MNWSNNQMRYAHIVGFMTCFRDEDGGIPFKTFIDKANELIDNFGFEMNYDQFEDLISVYNYNHNIDVVDGIDYIIVGDIDDDDDIDEDLLCGIVFMNNHLIKTISFEDFKKLKMNAEEIEVDEDSDEDN
jgi:hypothetical protein